MAERPGSWIVLSILVIAAVLAVYTPSLLVRAADPKHGIFGRDVAASLLGAAAVPAVGAWVAFQLRARGVRGAAGVVSSFAVSLLLLAASPLVLLFVHCTSGDCL
jgi:hypothetical protein